MGGARERAARSLSPAALYQTSGLICMCRVGAPGCNARGHARTHAYTRTCRGMCASLSCPQVGTREDGLHATLFKASPLPLFLDWGVYASKLANECTGIPLKKRAPLMCHLHPVHDNARQRSLQTCTLHHCMLHSTTHKATDVLPREWQPWHDRFFAGE